MEYYIVKGKKRTKLLHERIWMTVTDKFDQKKTGPKKYILSNSIYIRFKIGKTHLSLCRHLSLM